MSSGKIGYKRPPEGRRWRKGETGNPNGRPKREDSIAHYLQKALDAPITIKDGDFERVVTAREAIVALRMQAATMGDPNAMRDLLRLQKREVVPRRSQLEILTVEYVSAPARHDADIDQVRGYLPRT